MNRTKRSWRSESWLRFVEIIGCVQEAVNCRKVSDGITQTRRGVALSINEKPIFRSSSSL